MFVHVVVRLHEENFQALLYFGAEFVEVFFVAFGEQDVRDAASAGGTRCAESVSRRGSM